MACTKKTKTEPLLVRSVTLTPHLDTFLQALSQDASDATGWTVSKSAILRALVSLAEQSPPSWKKEHLFPLIEREIASVRVWGKRKQ